MSKAMEMCSSRLWVRLRETIVSMNSRGETLSSPSQSNRA